MTIDERLQQASDVRVGFSTSDGFVSAAIRWFTGGTVSHALLSFRLPDLGVCVLEAAAEGVVIRPGIQGETVSDYLPPAGVDLKAGLLAAAKLLGEAYDYGGLFGMAPVELLRRVGRRFANPTQSARAEFCSELACLAMQMATPAGWPGTLSLDRHSVDPEQLRETCEKAHG